MKTAIILACCATLIGSISAASAQTTGRSMDNSMTSGDRMNANDKMMNGHSMKKHSMKKHHMRSGSMSGDMDKGSMSGGGMKKGM